MYLSQIESDIRSKYNISYLATGDRKSESLSKRGMLAHVKLGIDEKHKKLYPVINFLQKDIYSYIKLYKLPLPVEYNTGKKRNFYIPAAADLLILKNNYPQDYKMIIDEFPKL
jgi:3'-phosphoadenosine 5'-phosphosulfate sulfotransferase (PAPS reductase)/FAD synthetase